MAGAAKSIYIIVSASSHIVRVAGINRYLVFKGIPAPSSYSSTVEPLRGSKKSLPNNEELDRLSLLRLTLMLRYICTSGESIISFTSSPGLISSSSV